MRRRWRAGSRARTDRQGVRRAEGGPRAGRQDGDCTAGVRQAVDRALQVSARHRLCRRVAAYRNRQAAALQVAGDRTMKVLQPPGWTTPKGYSNGIAARGTLIVVGGQIGWNAQQQFESDDFVAQARTALANVVAVL